MPDARKNIAMIKIAIKQLGISDDDGNAALGVRSTYRQMLVNLTGKDSCSESAMSDAERNKVIRHLKAKGFKTTRRARAKAPGMASEAQVGLIHVMWTALGDKGHLDAPGTASLNAWLAHFTKSYNRGAGYSSPAFLPLPVAAQVIESLKGWCLRVGIEDWK